jgi:hypothetical protein
MKNVDVAVAEIDIPTLRNALDFWATVQKWNENAVMSSDAERELARREQDSARRILSENDLAVS